MKSVSASGSRGLVQFIVVFKQINCLINVTQNSVTNVLNQVDNDLIAQVDMK